MSHRNARPCGYADGLTLLVSWMLRGSRHKSSSHLKDFLRSAQGQGGGSREHTGDWKTELEEREREMRLERGMTVPCGPVTISRVCSEQRGVGARAGPRWLGRGCAGPGEWEEVTSAQWGSYRGERTDFLPWLSLRNRRPAWFNPCWTLLNTNGPAQPASHSITL